MQFDDNAEPFGGKFFGSMHLTIAGSLTWAESGQAELARLSNAVKLRTGAFPRFLYARLWVDLVAATDLLIEDINSNCSRYFPGTPHDSLRAMWEFNVMPLDYKPLEFLAVRGRNEDRDAWLYAECCRGVQYSEILVALAKKAETDRGGGAERWDEISSIQGIQRAALRYAERHHLAPPPRRRRTTKASDSVEYR